MLKKLRKYYNQHFAFNRNEERGILFLIILIIATALVPKVIQQFREPVEITISSHEMVKIEAWEKSKGLDRPKQDLWKDNETAGLKTLKPFFFDPNTVTKEELKLLGVGKWAMQNLIKYRDRGGVIKTAEDFEKIYGLKQETFARLKHYIRIRDMDKSEDNFKYKSNDKQDSAEATPKEEVTRIENEIIEPVELNTADSLQLIGISGIGPFYAKNIISLRKKLGGFYAHHQLLELYAMDSIKLESLKPHLEIDSGLVEKINLNQISFDSFPKHPYLSYQQFKIIINYRTQHGDFKSIDELLNIHAISKEQFEQVEPYLTID